MLLSLEHFNNSQQLSVMGLISSLSRNHLSWEKSYWMLLAQIIRDQLTENSTNSIARNIRLNLDMIFRIKMILYWGLNKRLPQFGKGFLSSRSKKRSLLAAKVLSSGNLCFYDSDLFFGLSRFLTFWLAFTTLLCWLFFISILHLDSLTILLFISYLCWGW